jgi:hypothetical protein
MRVYHLRVVGIPCHEHGLMVMCRRGNRVRSNAPKGVAGRLPNQAKNNRLISRMRFGFRVLINIRSTGRNTY